MSFVCAFIMRAFLLLLFVVTFCSAQYGSDVWGYVKNDVQSAFFYYGTISPNSTAPLVFWLQGGPGGSSMFGKFLENGPTDPYGIPRKTSWTQYASMVWVDNPVGTGFSYTTSPSSFATTDEEIAEGLVRFATGFFTNYPKLSNNDFWIFTESYGGKMTANFGRALHKAIQQGILKANFKGVALGDGWLAPVECMKSYGPYLSALSLITQEQEKVVEQMANDADVALNQKNNGTLATQIWGEQQQYISNACGGCNWYNVINSTDTDAAEAQMNKICARGGSFFNQISSVVPSNVNFGSQSGDVFEQLSGAFMRPGVEAVEYLLQQGLQVNVYSGQLDIIVDELCTSNWINSMQWSGLKTWQNQTEQIVSIAGIPQGFYRSYQNFNYWKILRAGHMVPHDNPEMALYMMSHIIGAQ